MTGMNTDEATIDTFAEIERLVRDAAHEESS